MIRKFITALRSKAAKGYTKATKKTIFFKDRPRGQKDLVTGTKRT